MAKSSNRTENQEHPAPLAEVPVDGDGVLPLVEVPIDAKVDGEAETVAAPAPDVIVTTVQAVTAEDFKALLSKESELVEAPPAPAPAKDRLYTLNGGNQLGKTHHGSTIPHSIILRLGYSPEACLRAGWISLMPGDSQ